MKRTLGTLTEIGVMIVSSNSKKLRPQSADGARFILPRIVLRDPAGLPLDTYTSFQRAIEESRQLLFQVRNAKTTTEVLGPNEWRLPHAPVPARPDYTSAFGPLINERQRRMALKRTFGQLAEPSKLVVALDVDHCSAVNHLRNNELNNYHDWQLLCPLAESVGSKVSPVVPLQPSTSDNIPAKASYHTFLPFIGTVPQLSESEWNNGIGRQRHQHRDTKYFDGDSQHQACQNAFCGGCRRERVGFTFCYGCERDSQPHYHQDKTARTGGGFTYIKRDRPLYAIKRNNPLNWRVVLDNGRVVYLDGLDANENLHTSEKVIEEKTAEEDTEPADGTVQFLPTVVDLDLERCARTTTPASAFSDEENGVLEEDEWVECDEEVEGDEVPDELMDSDREVTDVDIPGSDDLENVEEAAKHEENDESEPSGQRRRLYNAPKAFVLQKRGKKSTEASVPFRTDRDLNLPEYGNFEIHKSDKKLTEFVSVRRGDDSWQAPDAFTLRERENLPDTWHLAEHPSVNHQLPAQTELAPAVPSTTEHTTVKKKVKRPSPKPAVKQPEISPKERPAKPSRQHDENKRTVTPDSGVGSVSILPPPVTSSSVSEPVKVEQPIVGPHPPTKSQPVQRRRPKAKEPVKKDRKQDTAKRVKSKNEEVPSEPQHDKHTPEPIGDVVLTPEPPFEPMTFKEHTIPIVIPLKHVEHPPLPTASPPSLPRMIDFIEPVKPIREISITQLEVPPPMTEPPRQRRPPPMLKPKSKPRRLTHPATRPVGAPVQAADMKNIGDPLDFLAKYCIIHPDRLPHYVRVFSKAVNEQMYRYSDVPHPEGQYLDDDCEPALPATDNIEPGVGGELPSDLLENRDTVKTTLTEAEEKKIKQFSVVNVSLKPEYAVIGMNDGDQTLAKINYTLGSMMEKYEDLRVKLDRIAISQVHMLASLARKQFPQITDPSYKPPKAKKMKKKKGKKKDHDSNADEPDAAAKLTANDEKPESQITQHSSKVSDIDIINRLDDKQLKALNVDTELSRLNLELQRLQEKLREVDNRIEELEDEKKLMQLYARDEFQRLETSDVKPDQFMRQQSALYQRMHPSVNVEMNVTDIEEALQEINGHLITKKEIQYIFHILNIPGRKRIDVQLFCVIAALSEKVAQVDPFIRKLINKFDYEALNTKMDRSKELFCLLNENETDVPLGKIATRMLAVELAAGGVTPEHTQFVLSKFNRENKGVVDFLDFLTYVPLFIEIHDRILNSPLQLERDW